MKLLRLKSTLMILVIGAFLCSFTPEGPSNETITKDWNTYFQRNSTKDCISSMTFKIVSRSIEKSELQVLAKISCDWNAQCDTVKGTKPSKLFMKGTGKNKTAGFKMVYVKEGKDWIFKGFIRL
ncbi:MAG: hypothetical protein ABSD71_11885 [Bacteroidales bacterium]|jgi:hypothetical protein